MDMKTHSSTPFAPWDVSQKEDCVISSYEFRDDCLRIMLENGLEPPDSLEMDGNLHRCGTEKKPHGKDGAYIVHMDEPYSLWWKNWHTGAEGTHTAPQKVYNSASMQQGFIARLRHNKAQREQAKESRHLEAQIKAQKIWDMATQANNGHAYLQRKQVPSYGLKETSSQQLAVPILTMQNTIQSLLFIPPDGERKHFLTGGKVAGGFFSIPSSKKSKEEPLCIAEGYSTAASIHLATGYTVLIAFTAGNLQEVALMARTQYPQRKIILCADNDVHNRINTGVVKAIEAAQRINGLMAVPPAIDKQNTDFNDAHLRQGLKAVRDCIEQASAPEAMIDKASLSTPDVLPLRKASQIPAAYPIKAFGPFTDVIMAFADGIKVPYAMAGGSVLTTLAACTQSIANIHTKDGRTIPLSLYALTIAESGDRKSSLDRVVLHKVNDIEEEWHQQYIAECKHYEQVKSAWEKQPKEERESQPFTLNIPKIPTMQVENVNVEGIFRLLKEGRPSLAIFSDEAGSFFGGTAFQKENVLKTISFFSKLWDGKTLDKIRSGEGFFRLYNRRASMNLMLQPAIAERLLSDEIMYGQGFLSRFLIAWPPTRRGTRFYEAQNIRNDPIIQYFYTQCEQLLTMQIRTEEHIGGMVLDALCINQDAHDLWKEYHDEVERKLAPDGEFAEVISFASKNSEQALRIAGVLTLGNAVQERTISAATMEGAIHLARWYLSEALRLRETGMASPEILKAERLLQWVKNEEHKYISTRLVMRRGPKALRSKKEADTSIRVLEAHGYLVKGKGSVNIEGILSKTFWEVIVFQS